MTIALENSQGEVQTGTSGMVTIALASGPAGVGLGGTLSVAVNQGVATFTDLTLDRADDGYTLELTFPDLPAVTTSAIEVTPAAATQLVITTLPPSSVTAGQAFGLAVTVEDSFGNVETGYSGPVTLAAASNPGGATVGGTLTETATEGVATFSNLTLNQATNGLSLQVSSGSLPAVTTAAINVGAAAGTNPPPTSGDGGTGSPSGGGQNTGIPTNNPSSDNGTDDRQWIQRLRHDIDGRFRRQRLDQGPSRERPSPEQEGRLVNVQDAQAEIAPAWAPRPYEVASCEDRDLRHAARYPVTHVAPTSYRLTRRRVADLRSEMIASPVRRLLLPGAAPVAWRSPGPDRIVLARTRSAARN